MDPKFRRLSDTGMGILLFFLGVFALVTLFFGLPIWPWPRLRSL